METIHIYPENDLEEHQLTGYHCQCEPEVRYDVETNSIFVTHHSFDGRELVEEVKRLLQSE